MILKLIIVRHGETVDNARKIMQGQLHGQLNAKGINQARKVGERLKDEKIDVIYCSDLKRAVQTAGEIIRYHPRTPTFYEKKLRERIYGDLEGKSEIEYHKQKIMHSRKSEFKPSGGETFLEVKNRMVKFYNNIIKKHMGQTILVVSHGSAIASLSY
ncbi:histidine phosphatase family protein [Candidatus Woesearchaeota archaeon]|nr:histidine phosphatase family protein [Candidatus Woesearchaeota archaeon]